MTEDQTQNAHQELPLTGTVTSYEPDTFSGVVETDEGVRYYIGRRTGRIPASGWTPAVLDRVRFSVEDDARGASEGRKAIAWLEKDAATGTAADGDAEGEPEIVKRLSPYFGSRRNLLLTLAGYGVITLFVLYLFFS